MMDRYDRIIRDIQSRTAQESLRWKVLRPLQYPLVVTNLDRVLRAFEGNYVLKGREYRLAFVEKRVDVHDEFNNNIESRGYELFVLDEEGLVVLPIYPGLVDRRDLLKLAGLIDAHNDLARDFFRAFDEPNVA